MKPAPRFLLALLTILSCTTITIAGAAVQEALVGVVLEKACVLEGETGFSTEFVAAKKSLMDQMSTDEAARYRKYWEKHAPEASKP